MSEEVVMAHMHTHDCSVNSTYFRCVVDDVMIAHMHSYEIVIVQIFQTTCS